MPFLIMNFIAYKPNSVSFKSSSSNCSLYFVLKSWPISQVDIGMNMSGAICGFAQSADRAARFADPQIA